MREYMELGPVPSDEPAVQVITGTDYMPAMRAELQRYKAFLEARFPDPPEGAGFRIKWNPHDFGQYGEVAVYFEESDREAAEYAYFVEGHSPVAWDDPEVFGPGARGLGKDPRPAFERPEGGVLRAYGLANGLGVTGVKPEFGKAEAYKCPSCGREYKAWPFWDASGLGYQYERGESSDWLGCECGAGLPLSR
jgi:hypothetical protein